MSKVAGGTLTSRLHCQIMSVIAASNDATFAFPGPLQGGWGGGGGVQLLQIRSVMCHSSESPSESTMEVNWVLPPPLGATMGVGGGGGIYNQCGISYSAQFQVPAFGLHSCGMFGLPS